MTNPTFRHAFRSRRDAPLFFVATQPDVIVFPVDADAPNWDGWNVLLNWGSVTAPNLNAIQTAAEAAGKMVSLEIAGGAEHPNAAAFGTAPDFAATDWWDDYETLLALIATELGDTENFVELAVPGFVARAEPFAITTTERDALVAGAPWWSAEVLDAFALKAGVLAKAAMPAGVEVRVNLDSPDVDASADTYVPDVAAYATAGLRAGCIVAVEATSGYSAGLASLFSTLRGKNSRGEIDGWTGSPHRSFPSLAGDAVAIIADVLADGADVVLLPKDGSVELWSDAAVIAAYQS